MKKALCWLCAALCLTACALSRTVDGMAGEWNVTEIEGQSITPGDDTPYLGFDLKEGTLYGFTGCNRLTGTLDARRLAAGEADFSRLGMTRMLCRDDRYEASFVKALAGVRKAEVEDGTMYLKGSDGKTLVVLKKK